MTKLIKNSFGNFLVIFVIFSLVTGWIFSGWPQIWQKPAIPPEIQQAWADFLNKIFYFASDAESWFGSSGNANTTLSWSSATGCPSTGSLRTYAYKGTGGSTVSSNYWQWTGTWEQLGVPAGNKVTQVQGGYQYTVTTYGATANQTGPLELRVGAGCTLQAEMLGSASISGTVGCTDRGQGSNVDVPTDYQASNSTICFRLNNTSNLAGGARTFELFEDTITLTINHSAVTPTVSCNTNISTTSFGTWTDNSNKTADPNASTTMSCSNTTSGCTLYIKDQGNGANPGLAATSPAYLIPSPNASFSASTTLSAGSEGYGIQATTTSSGLTIADRYLLTGEDVGGLATSTSVGEILAFSTDNITGAQVIVRHKAAISEITFAGVYEDTITYSCLIND